LATWHACKPAAEIIIRYLFVGGMEGVEIANWYNLHPNPLSAKKFNTAMGECDYIYFELVVKYFLL